MKPPVIARNVFKVASCLIVLAGAECAFSQESPAPVQQAAPDQEPVQQAAATNAAKPCIQPPPLPSLMDYDGPLKKAVGLFGRTLERKSVHPPRYKTGATLCSLELDDKFRLFVQDSIDPVNLLGAGFNAGIDQATNRDPTFGQGAEGYGKRFGASLADSVSSRFFKDFAYPAIFAEDPRYYRMSHGSSAKRLFHAAGHLFVAHRENGKPMFNYSEWLGSFSAAELSNLYHPGNEHGVGDTARRVVSSFAFDIGYDVLREFWPEISHKLKLPFRDEPRPTDPDAIPNHN